MELSSSDRHSNPHGASYGAAGGAGRVIRRGCRGHMVLFWTTRMSDVKRTESPAKGHGNSTGAGEIRLGKQDRGWATRVGARFSGQRRPWGLISVTAAALVLALALLPGCGSSTEATPESGGLVRGLVVAVEGRTIIELESLTIRDEAGKNWTFTSRAGSVGFTPSHLREHQLLGHPVEVLYVADGDTLVAVEITD